MNGGGGGYTGGNGAASSGLSGGGGGSFLADKNGTRQLDWYDEGNCSIEYVSRCNRIYLPTKIFVSTQNSEKK